MLTCLGGYFYGVLSINAHRRTGNLTLKILQAVELQSDVTQGRIANGSSVALGLADAYLKRCVRKRMIKLRQSPANRHLYYLTPKGLREKTRLTSEYLTCPLNFYREAGESLQDLQGAYETMGAARTRAPAILGLQSAWGQSAAPDGASW